MNIKQDSDILRKRPLETMNNENYNKQNQEQPQNEPIPNLKRVNTDTQSKRENMAPDASITLKETVISKPCHISQNIQEEQSQTSNETLKEIIKEEKMFNEFRSSIHLNLSKFWMKF